MEENLFMENQPSKIPLSKQLFSIPNILGYFRIILIPIIMWNYFHAQTDSDYYFVALLVVISGLTDALDGQIARRFHMVTPLGKALDPIADKLTQGALAVCLMTKYPLMIVLFALFLGNHRTSFSAPRGGVRRSLVREDLYRRLICRHDSPDLLPRNSAGCRQHIDPDQHWLHALQPDPLCHIEHWQTFQTWKKLKP